MNIWLYSVCTVCVHVCYRMIVTEWSVCISCDVMWFWQEWKPRWGYKRVNDPEDDWVLEVPDNAGVYISTYILCECLNTSCAHAHHPHI